MASIVAHALLRVRTDPADLNATAAAQFRSQCTVDTCPISDSYYAYRPSLPANALFVSLFALALLGFLAQAVWSRRFIGFSIAMVSGCILEVLGYAGRLVNYKNPFDQNGFLIQIVCLTIAPAFLAAGLYLTLSRIVLVFGPANSRISPKAYPRIFIPCDVLSLMLQATGGGMASTATHQNKSPKLGDHIMEAGLAFQVITLLAFICLCTDFAVRTLRRQHAMGKEEALDPSHAALRKSGAFRAFLAALALATACIFLRSAYRVAELGEGWTGYLISTQSYFIGFEGSLVVLAVLALNAFHPGRCFQQGYQTRPERRAAAASAPNGLASSKV